MHRRITAGLLAALLVLTLAAAAAAAPGGAGQGLGLRVRLASACRRSTQQPTAIASAPAEPTSPALSQAPQDPPGTPSASAPGASVTSLQPNHSAPDTLQITSDPRVNGVVAAGLPLLSPKRSVSAWDLARWIDVPRGASLIVCLADGSVAPVSARLATGQTIQVLDRSGSPIAKATVIVPGDVIGDGRPASVSWCVWRSSSAAFAC